MTAPTREEIAGEFGPWLNELQYKGQGHRDGRVFESYGICFVPNPYESSGQKKEGNASGTAR
jgi:hypothetical protein